MAHAQEGLKAEAAAQGGLAQGGRQDGGQPAGLAVVGQQEDHIVLLDELAQGVNILHRLRAVKQVARHGHGKDHPAGVLQWPPPPPPVRAPHMMAEREEGGRKREKGIQEGAMYFFSPQWEECA